MLSASERLAQYRLRLRTALEAITPEAMDAAASMIERAWRDGRTVFVCGNGGSAATASHLACDFAKTTLGKGDSTPEKRIRCVALTDNVPLITAWGNDTGYEVVFAEQLRNLAQKGDLLIAISASGNSPNILRALEVAAEMKVKSLGFLGFGGGRAASLADHAVIVDSNDYGVVEDAHAALMHVLTEWLRSRLTGG